MLLAGHSLNSLALLCLISTYLPTISLPPGMTGKFHFVCSQKLMVISQSCEENSRLGEGLGRMSVMIDWLCLPFMMDWLCLPWKGREHLRPACEVFTICGLHKLFTINDLAFSLSYIICPAVSDQLLSSSSSAATAKSLQSCPTLCDPIDGSPPGSPVPGILQARTLEWVAISFSNA